MRDSFGWRLTAEFFVIVLGVLLALAADRWNQGRADAAAESAYITRLSDEIREDSTRMASFLERLPSIMAARDSLLGVLDGAAAPPNFAQTIVTAVVQLDLNPPNAWRELEASSTLSVLRDLEVRAAVSTYYRTNREANDRNLIRAQQRGRDPFFDAAFQLQIFEPSFAQDGTPITVMADAMAMQPAPDVDGFRNWPGMRQLLAALGSQRLFQSVTAGQIMRNAGSVLQVLETANR